MKRKMSWNVKCYEMSNVMKSKISNVMKYKMLWNANHEIANVMKCPMSWYVKCHEMKNVKCHET